MKEILKDNVQVILFVKDNDVDYYKKKINVNQIIIEPVLFNKSYNLLKYNLLNHFFVLVRKCMSGGRSGYNNTTDDVMVFQYARQLSNSLLGIILFLFVRITSVLGRKFKGFRRATVELEGKLFPGKMYDHYFDKYDPQMLITSSLGYMIDPFFMRAARRHNCRIVSIIHSWDNPTTKDYRGIEPDHVIAWNDIMKEEVNIFHDIPDEKIFTGGIAHWDFYFNGTFTPNSRKIFCKNFDFDKNKKIIFYGTSSPVLFKNSFDVVQKLLEKIQSGVIPEQVQLLVRLHPTYLTNQNSYYGGVKKEYYSRMKDIIQKYPNLVCFNIPEVKFLTDDYDMPIEDMYMLANILHHSSILLTEYSTLMIEAAIFDLPIINVAMHNFRDTDKPASYFENFTHIKRILKTGACKNAYNYGDLLEYINDYLEDSSRDNQKRKQLVAQEITTNIGCAGQAIGKHLSKLL